MSRIIGIGGCSRSGKSTLARRIKERFSDLRVLILDMDDFVLPEDQIPKIKDLTDWELPASVDFKKLIQAVKTNQEDHDIIIVEGILIFAYTALLDLFDTTIFIEISKETFLDRRKRETRWGEEPDWFIEHVWESHLKYGTYKKTDIIVSGENQITNEVLNDVINNL
ncbi:AAA family ATPase [Ekhidna sp.]